MTLTLTNKGTDRIVIADLAMEIGPDETVDLNNYSARELLASSDFPLIFNETETKINGESVNYQTFVARLTSLTVEKHETLATLKHNVSENYFFETTKDSAGQTQLITYYEDSSKQSKIREEEVSRNAEGSVSQIIIREYDDNILIKTETQLLNRSASGKVESISVSIN